MKFNSIKSISFIYLFSFITVLVLSISLLSLEKIKDLMYLSIDRSLNNESDIIIALMKPDDSFIELEITEIISGNYVKPKSGHYYKMIINNNNSGFKVHDTKKILHTVISPSLVDENFNFKILSLEKNIPERNEIFFTSVGLSDEPLRVLKKDINFKGTDITLYISEPIKETLSIINNFKFFITLIFLFSLIFSAIIITLIINIFLNPLKLFSNEIKNISHKNLNENINDKNYPDELKEMVLSFNKMLIRINKAFETERIILSESSHKLKTPIAVIKSYCDVILKKDREKDEYIDTIKSIKSVTNRIISLVSGILSLAKLESENITYNKLEKTSINECLNSSIDLAEYLAYQRNIQINFEPKDDIYVLADKDKLIEAFLNIIENGIKYNKDSGFININAYMLGNNVNISIKDTGKGISKEEQGKIFERFYRINENKNIEGNGLGLNIVKTIIESHEGEIKVNSNINDDKQGSEFIIILKTV